MTTNLILQKAAAARKCAAMLSENDKNKALLAISDRLNSTMTHIIHQNEQDIERSRSTMSGVMIDRLMLSEERIRAMANGVRDVAALPDPVGEIIESFTRPDGLKISKVRVPLGVIAIIYESRPNVTSDAAALCLKSGNLCFLPA